MDTHIVRLEVDRITKRHHQLWDEELDIFFSSYKVLVIIGISMYVYMHLIVHSETFIPRYYLGLGPSLPTACLVALVTGIYLLFCWMMVRNEDHTKKTHALCRRLRSLKQEAIDLCESYSNSPDMTARYSIYRLSFVRDLIDPDRVRDEFASHCRTSLWMLALYSLSLITWAMLLLYEIRIFS
ncbi:hypothetical protein CDL15_Pgr017128 [Punica granatum]|uniref:Uncharacterized protein n=1 Tax=Punica granatum TaxID=22663 RepID=A0A218W036_PUNGR|nr:hypothetical protein CDL15_Pgr017128 [Punica granatum]